MLKMHKKTLSNEPIAEDLLHYARLCREGVFYETIAQQAGVSLTVDNRKKFKEDFYSQVFYSRVRKSAGEIKEAFIELFPNVHKMIVGMKKVNYKSFAIHLQDLEALLMVYTVYKDLLDEGYKVLVLHDAILCGTVAAETRAKEMISECFEGWLGMEISFKRGLIETTDHLISKK